MASTSFVNIDFGMRKVLIIGSGGSGKSTFASHLGQLTNLDVIHLDQLYWRSGWVETPKHEWLEIVSGILNRDQWIIDGNYSGTLEVRLKACDTIVFLDLPRTICVWRIVWRMITNWRRTRPDMTPGCPEKFNLGFIRWVWDYPVQTKPGMVRLLEDYRRTRRVITLNSRRAVRDFLSSFES